MLEVWKADKFYKQRGEREVGHFGGREPCIHTCMIPVFFPVQSVNQS